MKTKRLLFISCLAAGAVIASPSFGKPAKKSTGTSQSKKRLQTTQVTGNDRHNQNISPRKSSIRHYGQARYSGTRSSVGRQYSGTRYYGRTRYSGTIMGAATAIIMRVDLTLTTAITRVGRTQTGVTAYPRGITRIRIGAAIRIVVTTTTTRTTRQRTAITHQWLQLCSGASANSVITMA